MSATHPRLVGDAASLRHERRAFARFLGQMQADPDANPRDVDNVERHLRTLDAAIAAAEREAEPTTAIIGGGR